MDPLTLSKVLFCVVALLLGYCVTLYWAGLAGLFRRARALGWGHIGGLTPGGGRRPDFAPHRPGRESGDRAAGGGIHGRGAVPVAVSGVASGQRMLSGQGLARKSDSAKIVRSIV